MRDLWLFLKLYKRHRLLLLLGMLLAVVALAASAGLLALSGWFITATSLAGLSLVSAQLFNFFTPGAGVRGFSILRTASRYFERLVSHDATFRLLAWLRVWFFSRLVPLPLEQINRYRKGDLLNRLVADVDALDQLYLRLLSPLVAALVVTGLITALLAWFSPGLALFALGVMGGWILLMPVLFYRLGRGAGESLGQRQKDLRQQVLDHLQGMAEALIYGYSDSSRLRLHRTEAAMGLDQQRMARLEGVGAFLVVAGGGCAGVVMLWLASGQYALQQFSAPVMALMVFVQMAGFEALMPLPGAFQFLSHTRQAATRLREVLEEPPRVFPESDPESDGNSTVLGQLRFDAVSFAYGERSTRPVLAGLDLTVAPGERLALLGRTGCGKSTLIGLLNRSIEPTAGTIWLDGRALPTLTEQTLFAAMTFIPQKTHVYAATLRDNLRLAAAHSSDDQLLEVIARTGLDRLGGGGCKQPEAQLGLWLGQGGLALSGGEQRRLAAARALLKPAPVLIMDEPTEGLDAESEQSLMGVLLDAFSNSTIIMITHKKVMLERMSRLYQMTDGRLKALELSDLEEVSVSRM